MSANHERHDADRAARQFLTRQFLTPSLRTEVVSVPEWGMDVTLREMTLAQRIEFEERLRDGDNDRYIRALIVIHSAVDDSGQPLFAPDDLEALLGQSYRVILRLSNAAFRVNALGDDELDEARRGF